MHDPTGVRSCDHRRFKLVRLVKHRPPPLGDAFLSKEALPPKTDFGAFRRIMQFPRNTSTQPRHRRKIQSPPRGSRSTILEHSIDPGTGRASGPLIDVNGLPKRELRSQLCLVPQLPCATVDSIVSLRPFSDGNDMITRVNREAVLPKTPHRKQALQDVLH